LAADFTTHGIGRTVGSYTLEEEVGRGGMGVVYRARRVDTGETVALKLMLPEISANHHFRARFVREASLGSDLDHPNVVPIYDAGEADGELYIAMRLVEGRDLKTVIEEEGRLDPRRLVGIMRQVAGALDAAHEAGIVHHDVKPQNILIASDDGPDRDLAFVSDFGLVRPAGSESTASRTGQVFGSIQYMPPEQVEGLPSDGRADVYALGCVLYECLTGQIPFDRPNEVAVLWAHVHEQPGRVTDVDPRLPGGVDAVVATAMAKHPDDRFLTCGELIEELEKGLERKHRPVVMPIVRPLVKRVPRRKTEREVWAPNYFPELSRVRKLTERTNWVQVTGVVAILSILAASLVQFAHPRGITGAVADVATAVGSRVLDAGSSISDAFDATEDKGSPMAAEVGGPVRRSAAQAAEHEELGRARRQPALADQVDGDPASNVAATPPPVRDENHYSPRDKIVFDALGYFWRPTPGLYTMNPDGRGVRLLYDSEYADREPTWSPDGKRIAFARGDAIYVIGADGSGLQQVTFGSGISREPSWSPSGDSLLYARTEVGVNDWDIYRVDLADPGVPVATQLTSGPAQDRDPEWSPSGSTILFTRSENGTDRLMTMRLDGTSMTSLTDAALGAEQGEWDPSGDRVVFVDARGHIRILSVGSTPGTTIDCGDWCFEPSFTPDGAGLLFGACRRSCEEVTIFSLSLRRPERMTPLERDVYQDTEADWR
jgi:hypothetical protein